MVRNRRRRRVVWRWMVLVLAVLTPVFVNVMNTFTGWDDMPNLFQMIAAIAAAMAMTMQLLMERLEPSRRGESTVISSFGVPTLRRAVSRVQLCAA